MYDPNCPTTKARATASYLSLIDHDISLGHPCRICQIPESETKESRMPRSPPRGSAASPSPEPATPAPPARPAAQQFSQAMPQSYTARAMIANDCKVTRGEA
eukprot:scaffold106416_cov31-Prasinocladus_malaysianus.AAC.1